MKKAVINTGGKQYLVTEGQELTIERIKDAGKTLTFEPLLTIDGEKINVGSPLVNGAKVIADVVSNEERADKVTAIRYKAKKRVRKIHGHRQQLTSIKIKSIS